MDIGVALLIGLCFCGLIYLYTQTKDTWNWAKMRKAVLVTMGALISLALITVGGFLLYEYYQGLPRVIIEFEGLKLGDSRSDVTFRLGEPGKYSIHSPDGKEETMTFKSYAVSVTLRDNKVKSITYSCKLNESDYTSLNGISCGDRSDKILTRFNSDVEVFCPIKSKQDGPGTKYEESTRVYDVVKYGTRYYLSINSVTNMEIASPETLKSYLEPYWDKPWDKCQ